MSFCRIAVAATSLMALLLCNQQVQCGPVHDRVMKTGTLCVWVCPTISCLKDS